MECSMHMVSSMATSIGMQLLATEMKHEICCTNNHDRLDCEPTPCFPSNHKHASMTCHQHDHIKHHAVAPTLCTLSCTCSVEALFSYSLCSCPCRPWTAEQLGVAERTYPWTLERTSCITKGSRAPATRPGTHVLRNHVSIWLHAACT